MARNKNSFDFLAGLDLIPESSGDKKSISKVFDDEAITAMNDASHKGTLKWVDVGALDEDPDNRLLYGDYDTKGLSESIAESGFRGVIMVYPSTVKNRYVIESGHRSLEAAKNAGLTIVPVIVGDAPKDDIERRKRLTGGNQHRRKYTPMMMAREAQYQFETYEMEKKRNKELGITDSQSLLEKVAKDLEISTSQVTKYRQLLSLNKNLQDLVETGDYNWAIMATASQLTEAQQKSLFLKITGYVKTHNIDSVSGAWLKNEIEEMKYYRLDADRERILSDVHEMASRMEEERGVSDGRKARFRRIDGTKAIRKSLEGLRGGVGSGAFIKDKSKEQVIKDLREMRSLIDEKLSELEK